MSIKMSYWEAPAFRHSKTIEQVLNEICVDLDVDMKDILKLDRSQPLIDKRHIMMYVLNVYCRLTTTRVAELLKRDHSSIIHAKKKVENLDLLKEYKANFKKFLVVSIINEKQYRYEANINRC